MSDTDHADTLRDSETQCCGHVYDTRAERVAHEQAVERGKRVVCPCGDVCNEGVAARQNGGGSGHARR